MDRLRILTRDSRTYSVVEGFVVAVIVLTLATSCQLTDLMTRSSLTRTPASEKSPFESDVPEEPLEDRPEIPAIFAMLSANEAGSWVGSDAIDTGTQIQIVADFNPVIFLEQEDTISQRLWDPHNVEKMRYCFNYDEACVPRGEWLSFESEKVDEIVIDWLGLRTVWLSAEFQDRNGASILALASDSEAPEAIVHLTEEIIGRLNESTPMARQPTAIQTSVAVTRAFAPIAGSVLIEEGRCCAGGVAGETIDVTVSFEASSPEGEVTEMRSSNLSYGCQQDINIDEQPWEPFVTDKVYPVTTATNWIGFYVRVQYRDSSGNLSPIFCDDISIEGMPPTPRS